MGLGAATLKSRFLPAGGAVRYPAQSPGEYPSGQRGQTVNLLAYAFTGSNPVSPIPAPWTYGSGVGAAMNGYGV